MFFSLSDGAKGIIDSLVNNSQQWVQGNYKIVNKKSPDIKIWTANGVWHIQLNGNDAFSLREKFAINAAIKKSIANKLDT